MTAFGLMRRLALRPPGGLAARLLLMSVVSFGLCGALLVRYVLEDAALRGSRRLGADLLIMARDAAPAAPESPLPGVVPTHSVLPEKMEKALLRLPGIISVVPRYLSMSAADPCCETGDLLLVGFDPVRDHGLLSWLRPGAAVPSGDEALLVGGKVLKAPGGSIRLHDHPFRVAGRLDRTGDVRFDSAVFIPFAGLRTMERTSRQGRGAAFTVPWGRPSLLLAEFAPSVNLPEMARTLEQRYPGVRAVPAAKDVRAERQRLTRIAAHAGLIPFMVWPPTLLVGAGLLAATVRERRRSLGLMLSLGHGRQRIIMLSGLEAGIVTLVAVAVGMGGACAAVSLLTSWAADATGLPLLAGGVAAAIPELLLNGLVFAAALAAILSAVTWRLLRHDPADLMRGI